MGLVDLFLVMVGGFDDLVGFDFECGGVEVFEVLWDVFDLLYGIVVVF